MFMSVDNEADHNCDFTLAINAVQIYILTAHPCDCGFGCGWITLLCRINEKSSPTTLRGRDAFEVGERSDWRLG